MAKVKGKQLLEGRDAMVDLTLQQNPGRGRAAAAATVAEQLGPKYRRRVAEAEQQVARKRARKAAAESAKRSRKAAETLKKRVDRAIAEQLARPGIREALTAAKAGSTAADLTKISTSELDAQFLTVASQVSPTRFYQSGPDAPAAGAAAAASPAAADLAAMSMDELRVHHAVDIQATAAAGGFGSPIYR